MVSRTFLLQIPANDSSVACVARKKLVTKVSISLQATKMNQYID